MKLRNTNVKHIIEIDKDILDESHEVLIDFYNLIEQYTNISLDEIDVSKCIINKETAEYLEGRIKHTLKRKRKHLTKHGIDRYFSMEWLSYGPSEVYDITKEKEYNNMKFMHVYIIE